MNSRRFARTLILALSLSACVENIEVAEVVETTNVIFSPSTGTIPLPNDLLFLGSTDLTLNLPAPADPVQQGLFDAVNALDGWSTTSPLSISFDGPIEGNLVNLMSSVHLFEVLTLGQLDPADQYPPVGTPVVGVTQQLTPGLDYMPAPLSDDPSNDTIVVLPLAPLKAGSSYMLVITNGMNDADGEAVSFGPEYELARHTTPYPSDHPLYGLQILVNAMEAVAVSDGGLDRDDIVLTLTFTTQSIGSALGATFAIANGGEAGVLAALCATGIVDCSAGTDPDPSSATSFGGAPDDHGTTADYGYLGTANVITESFTLPYYLSGPSNSGGAGVLVDFTNPTALAPLVSYWTSRYPFMVPTTDTDRNVTGYNPVPAATRAETIPVIVTTPTTAPPASGWPCAIFQHGITDNRSEILSIADALAAEGIACVAIDLPLHGITDITSPFFADYDTDGVHERSFGLDLQVNATLAPGSDGVADTSGAHFINFTSLRTNRDNLAQGATDLFHLTAALGTLDVWDSAGVGVGADGAPDIDVTQLHLVGNSLGAIVSTPFLSIQQSNAPVFASATMAAPAGNIANTLVGSPSYGPFIQAGLASLGIFPGTAEWNLFLLAAQTVTDSSDAINYAASFNGGSADSVAIHVIEYVGGGTMSGSAALPDQTVPNTVATAPLAGTEPLIALMGLTQVSAQGDTAQSKAVVKFQEGSHRSLVDPVDLGGIVTAEAQAQMATFAASGGATIRITDETLISPNPQP
ncbi:MAG: hypothetical protein CL933_01000 [Deltaproteobacteria bacterium]|nr:hypothetical protein [Deltaproteobacteria bacterium]